MRRNVESGRGERLSVVVVHGGGDWQGFGRVDEKTKREVGSCVSGSGGYGWGYEHGLGKTVSLRFVSQCW